MKSDAPLARRRLEAMMMFSFRVFPRIYLAVAFVIGVVIFGSVGYMVVEGYSWVEALFMTIITVSTVGFGEVRPLSDQGMVFTTILIMGSLGTFAYSISALTTYFVNGEYRNNADCRVEHDGRVALQFHRRESCQHHCIQSECR